MEQENKSIPNSSPMQKRQPELHPDVIRLHHEQSGKSFSIKTSQFDVGRSAECTMQIDNPYVARKHVTFLHEESGWHLMDNNSTNGTWLNGEKLQPGVRYRLRRDDEIVLADVEKLVFFSSHEMEVPQVQADPLVGTVVAGKYQVGQNIGSEGNTAMYMVTNVHTGAQWVMRTWNKTAKGYAPSVRELIIKETKMVMELRHPMIPLIDDIVENEQYICVIREYIPGQTLGEIVRHNGAQSQMLVTSWVMQICSVLKYLHSQNPPRIYRDMKPGNLVLRPDGSLMLKEFNTMRIYNPSKKGDTYCLGTRGYAAPEQYGGMGQTDARTDIFNLGMTMYHLLTGRDPEVLAEDPKPIRQYDPSLSEGLEKVVSKCVEADPKKRFQTVDALLKALSADAEPKRFKWFGRK